MSLSWLLVFIVTDIKIEPVVSMICVEKSHTKSTPAGFYRYVGEDLQSSPYSWLPYQLVCLVVFVVIYYICGWSIEHEKKPNVCTAP